MEREMSDHSAIEWTDATWNPVTGCTKVSPGCAHCYAETFAERFGGVRGHPYEQGFDLKLWPQRLQQPLQWKRPRRVFVNSMSDLFHPDVPDAFIVDVFDVMSRAAQHQFQVLTKRPERTLDMALKLPWPSNVWMGVSVENQRWSGRVDALRAVPARVRFISCEPLLGPLSLDLAFIDWVIAGGESGPRARRMNPAWVVALRDQCIDAGVPFFFKQWGAHDLSGRRVGKKAAGRQLEGRTWDGFPVPNQTDAARLAGAAVAACERRVAARSSTSC
jgi:protein gp37